MVGILVHGDNHFIFRGPVPSHEISLALVQRWSLIQIGPTRPGKLDEWRISTSEFRESLEWAVVVPGDAAESLAVTHLLRELSLRGIEIHDSRSEVW
jgi:hypothetical protein